MNNQVTWDDGLAGGWLEIKGIILGLGISLSRNLPCSRHDDWDLFIYLFLYLFAIFLRSSLYFADERMYCVQIFLIFLFIIDIYIL